MVNKLMNELIVGSLGSITGVKLMNELIKLIYGLILVKLMNKLKHQLSWSMANNKGKLMMVIARQ